MYLKTPWKIQLYPLLFLFLFSGCKKEKPEEQIMVDSLSDTTRIAIIGRGNSPVWRSLKSGIEKAHKEHPDILLNWLLPQIPDDLTQQKKIVSELDTNNTGVIVDPVDEVAISLPLRKLLKHKISVATLGLGLEKDIASSHISTPTDSLGIKPALQIGKLLSGKGPLLIITPPDANDQAKQITTAFKTTLQEQFPEISILAEESYEEPSVESAFALSETMLIMNPQVKAVFCTHPTGTQGMLKALQDIGKASSVALVGVGFVEFFELAIGEGEIQGIYIEDTFLKGTHLLENLLLSIAKKDYPAMSYSEIRAITRENIHSEPVQNLLQSLALE